jgi:hypothetical protein
MWTMQFNVFVCVILSTYQHGKQKLCETAAGSGSGVSGLSSLVGCFGVSLYKYFLAHRRIAAPSSFPRSFSAWTTILDNRDIAILRNVGPYLPTTQCYIPEILNLQRNLYFKAFSLK